MSFNQYQPQEENNWQREKEGLPPTGNAQAQWMLEKQGYSTEEANWMQDKTGLNAQETQWMLEKQGYSGEEARWMLEKQGVTKKPRWPLYLLGGLMVAVALAAIVIFVLLSAKPKNSEQKPVVVGSATTPASPSPAESAAVVTPEATPLPTFTPLSTARNGPDITDADRLYKVGKADYDAGRWEAAATALEKISPQDTNYNLVVPLLAKSYFELGNLAFFQDRSLTTAQKASDYYHKVQKIEPSFQAIEITLREIDLYIQARNSYDQGQCQNAVQPSQALYEMVKKESQAAKYRDISELYYNCLVVLGEQQENLNTKVGLEIAVGNFVRALGVDVEDKSKAQTALTRVQQELNPPTAVPNQSNGYGSGGSQNQNPPTASASQPTIPPTATFVPPANTRPIVVVPATPYDLGLQTPAPKK